MTGSVMAPRPAASKRWPVDWRRVVIYGHRWLGIAGGVLFTVWFVSGIVMMYARMPILTPQERLSRLPNLDLSTARVAPYQVADRLRIAPQSLKVRMLGDRPVYRFLERSRWTTAFADTGQPARGLTPDEALDLTSRFVPEHASTISYDKHLSDPDQWTLQSRALLPMHRIALGDPEDTYLYISDQTGEAVMKTTRRGRRWAYLGAVLHWLYFTPFRRHTTLWSQIVIWLTIAGCVLSVSGLVWGVWRYSSDRQYRLKGLRSRSPYAGLMRWHHYAGLTFGLVTFTWVLSGCLSMDPWNWHSSTTPTPEQRAAVAGGRLRLDALTVEQLRAGVDAIASSFSPKELDVLQFQREPLLLAYRAPSNGSAASSATTDPAAFLSPALSIEHRLVSAVSPEHGAFTRFDDEVVLAAARAAMPGTPIDDASWLEEYDGYYYALDGARPLPVLRVRFADPPRTWLYLDPRGMIALKEERLSRLNRWLYHGLHSLDFPFLYDRRPLWDIVVIMLSVGGILLATTTMAQAWRRLRRHGRRWARLAR